MTSEEDFQPRETAQEVLDFVTFAGYSLSRDQLVRLHQKRLIGPPETHYPGGRRGIETTYPPGTAQRVIRIVQMKANTKKFDELAWRLWWEGHDVELELVRDYLLKTAARWDQRRALFQRVAEVYIGIPGTEGERDLFDEFLYKKKIPPPLGTIRKRLRNGDKYVEFARLLVDLAQGRTRAFDQREVELFEEATGYQFAEESDQGGESIVGVKALEAMGAFFEESLFDVANSLEDDELHYAKSFTHFVVNSFANLGTVMGEVYGGTGRGYGLIGRVFKTLTDDADEQVMCLLLVSLLLRDPDLRENLPEFEKNMIHFNGVTYPDYQRLRYLANVVPGVRKLMTPSRLRAAFESPEGAEKLRVSFVEFRFHNAKELGEAFALRPDLFEDVMPNPEELT